ncbi:peptidoglycan-binding protein [Streptomyces sp. M2CJ-2]|uniref:peptidoglycan-binding protein n=1 Tax=Streptomyces sp. M2CJ-2 TaxID=2803948 RepID=UPI0027DC2E5D|nr:peptidoglycan-binding protein [Streptomyces sp. M2CJ-2]
MEDFHPLRIRPYVEFDDGTPATAPNAAPGHDAAPEHAPEPEAGQGAAPPTPAEDRPDAPPAADATMQLRAVPPDATSVPPSATPGPATGPTPAPTPLAAPLAPPTTEPSTTDLHLFEATRPTRTVPAAAGPATGPGPDDGGPPPGGRRRRRAALLAAAGAVVAVAGAAGWASGLFAYEAPSRDGALPDDVRVSVPDVPSASPSASASPSEGTDPAASPSLLVSASASPSENASPSASESVSVSESSASATPSDTAEPSSAAPTTAPAEALEEGTDEEEREVTGAVLRRGDHGPEVVELQQRLRQLHLYNSEIHGRFNRRVEDALRTYQWSRGIRGDELGVYGPETRSRLESETREP